MNTALYRFYDVGGQLLYVGITKDPPKRFTKHGDTKDWWRQVVGITVEWHPNRPAALAAEVRAIAVEHPKHNIQRPDLPSRRKRTVAQEVAPKRLDLIEWVCDVCFEPVGNGDGYVHVAMRDVDVREAAERERAAGQAGDEASWATVNLRDLMDWDYEHPEARWMIHHGACDPEPDEAYDYWFDVSRARTPLALMNWVLHLSEKPWIQATNWIEFVRDILGRNRMTVDA